MGRAKKTETKKMTTAKERTTKKPTAKKVKVNKSGTSSPEEDPLSSISQDDTVPAPKGEEEMACATRGEDVVILETDQGSLGFNTRDKLQGGKLVELKLTKGLNRVPVSLFETFEEDEFFSQHIIGGNDPVVRVISRPGKSLDKVDI